MEDALPRPPTRVDLYQVLSLAKEASAAEVKIAYKKLALKHHPGMLCIDCVKIIFLYQRLTSMGQTKLPQTSAKLRTRNSKKSPLPTPSYPTLPDVIAMIPLVLQPIPYRTTSTGLPFSKLNMPR